MKSLRYLNSVLTVIAVLLSLNLWTIWTMSPVAPSVATRAHAQEGLPNAGAQRGQMIDLLRQQVKSTDEMASLLKSGKVKVIVEGLDKK
ncbi:MAG: hypothetical protein WD768_20220 [Phycisphaeraceae bacterium]